MGEQQKPNEFGPVTYEAWRELVARDLAGAPFEKKLVKQVAGLAVQPLYAPGATAPDSAGLPGFAPFTRGSWPLGAVEGGWDVRQEVALSDVQAAASAVLDELNGGATSLSLKLDRAARTGSGERGVDGLSLAGSSDLGGVLEHVDLARVPLSLNAGASALPVAAGLFSLARARSLPLTALTGCLGADPIGTLAANGSLSGSLTNALADVAALARFTHENTRYLRSVLVSTSDYHDAGADAATEIAIALATGVAYLRALTEGGLDIHAAAKQLVFGFSIGRDLFVEIAKLRAARHVWARVVSVCGGNAEAQAMVIHARTSFRTKTQRDPWVNLLRATAESFSAAAGGADAITTSTFDEPLGESDEFARRLARNTQHLLRHESSVHRVVDPAGGSWYVESMSAELAKLAWQKFQALEAAGGIAAVLASGSLQKELSAALASERKAVETRKLSITGVNEFPHVREAPVMRSHGKARANGAAQKASLTRNAQLIEQLITAAGQGATFAALLGALSEAKGESCTALVRERLSQPFETLRDAADAFAAKSGRPKVFLANLGPIPAHKARASFAQNFFEAGGFTTLGNDGFATPEAAAQAFRESGAEIACLCSSDEVYAELAENTARAIAALGAKAILLAGSPGEKEAAYRAAGLSDFIFVGANVCTVLRTLLANVGALS